MSGDGGPRIYLSTGEPSGDLHAESVVRALRTRLPGACIEATGGPRVASAGAAIRHSIRSFGTMGAAEILGTIPRHLMLYADLRRNFRAAGYDLLILVDYPGFHMRLARAAAETGIPVLYYIAPQLWAWGAGRAAALRRSIRELAVILPFEEPFFRGMDIPATFVGHPLLDRTPPERSRARARLCVQENVPVLALLPGSRAQEHTRMWPIFRETAALLRQQLPDLQVTVAGTSDFEYPGAEGFTISRDASEQALWPADAALCKSGTVTLEAALAGVPMVVAYRMHPLTYALARRMVRVPSISLVNLVAGRTVAPEYLQQAATPWALAAALRPLLERDHPAGAAQRAAFPEIRERLGTPGAGQRVADIAARLVA